MSQQLGDRHTGSRIWLVNIRKANDICNSRKSAKSEDTCHSKLSTYQELNLESYVEWKNTYSSVDYNFRNSQFQEHNVEFKALARLCTVLEGINKLAREYVSDFGGDELGGRYQHHYH